MRNSITCVLLVVCTAVLALPSNAQAPPSLSTPYVVIENRELGGVKIVMPHRPTPLTIGRVVSVASTFAKSAGSSVTGVVEDSGAYGLLVGLGDKRAIRIMPSLSAMNVPPGTIVLALGDAKLFPPAITVKPGTPLFVSTGRRFEPVRRGFVPRVGDVVALPLDLQDRESSVQQLLDLAAQYVQQLLWIAVKQHMVVANGMLTIHTHFSADEPDRVFAVMLSTDGQLSDLTNKAPFTLNLDTRTISDGLHTVTVSAMNKNGQTITSASRVIMVYNHVFGPPAPKAQQSSPLNH